MIWGTVARTPSQIHRVILWRPVAATARSLDVCHKSVTHPAGVLSRFRNRSYDAAGDMDTYQ
jgi:hypothetical protein